MLTQVVSGDDLMSCIINLSSICVDSLEGKCKLDWLKDSFLFLLKEKTNFLEGKCKLDWLEDSFMLLLEGRQII